MSGLPSMDSSNIIARLVSRIERLERVVQANQSASGTLDAATIYKGGLTILNPENDGRMRLADGSIYLWDDYDANPAGYGRILCDPDAGINYLRLYAPNTGAEAGNNALTIQGDRPGLPGNMWLYTDGVLTIETQDETGTPQGEIFVHTPILTLWSPEMRLYGLPSTGSAANLRLETGSGPPILQFVTSSRRYKMEIEDAAIEPHEVLQLQPRTWIDKGTAERIAEAGGDTSEVRRNVGFIAEELDEIPSMRQFVDYDTEGRPDAIQYDRLSVALLELAKDQERRLIDQQSQIDALTKRFDALEAVTK